MTEPTTKRPWGIWLPILIGWTLVGLTFTLNYYFFAGHYVAIFKQQPSLKEMLIWELPYWFLWAALSPVIFSITRRFRIERGSYLSSTAIHIFACLLLSIIHRAVYLIVCWLLHVAVYRQFTSIPQLYQSDIFFNLPVGFMSYGTILLVSHVVDYYHRYREEELKISRLKAELAEAQLRITEAQLQALKMQLHPHFLFNTLNSISALLDEDVEAADEMLARLGDFLRMTLENSGAQEVTLQEELEFLRCYLEIEHVRFHDRLTVSFDVSPDTLEARVPNLLLQPIVENAIRHGIVSRSEPGRIDISSSSDGGRLRLQVRDNGPGLAPIENSGGKLRAGLGLGNTRARLEQLYGASHRFEMTDVPEGGLQVTLDLPLHTAVARSVQPEAALGD